MCVGWVGMGGWTVMNICWVGGWAVMSVLGGWGWVVGQ